MFGWAKKLSGIFPIRDSEHDPLTVVDADQEKSTSKTSNQSPEKETECQTPESHVTPEKRTPTLGKRLPQLLGISYDGRTPTLRFRSRSKSPGVALTQNHSKKVKADSTEKINKNNSCQGSGNSTSSQEETSNSSSQWYIQSNKEPLLEKSNSDPEQSVPQDRHDSSDRQSTPETYYTPNSSRPTSIKSLNTESSEVNTKLSLSEKVFGEVLKGFDKLGEIRSVVFSKEVKDLDRKEHLKETREIGENKYTESCSNRTEDNTNQTQTKQMRSDKTKIHTNIITQNGKDEVHCNRELSGRAINQMGSSSKHDLCSSYSESNCLPGQLPVTPAVDLSVHRINDELIAPELTQIVSSTQPKILDATLFTVSRHNESPCCKSEQESGESKVQQKEEQIIQSSEAQKIAEKTPVPTVKTLAGNGSTLLSPSIVQRIAKEGSSPPKGEDFSDRKLECPPPSVSETQAPDNDSFEAALLSFEKAVEVFPCSSSNSQKDASPLPLLPSSELPSDVTEEANQSSSLQSQQPDGSQQQIPQCSDESEIIDQPSPPQSLQPNETLMLHSSLSDKSKDIGLVLQPRNNEQNCVSPLLPPSKMSLLPPQDNQESISSNQQHEQTMKGDQDAQIDQEEYSNKTAFPSQIDSLKKAGQSTLQASNKQEGNTMISLLKDIHLLNKQLYDSVKSSQPSENKLVDDSNAPTSTQGTIEPQMTPLPPYSCSPSSRFVRIPQCDFIDSEQEAVQSFKHPAGVLCIEKHFPTPQCDFIDADQETIQLSNHPSNSSHIEEHDISKVAKNAEGITPPIPIETDRVANSTAPTHDSEDDICSIIPLFDDQSSNIPEENSNQETLVILHDPSQFGEKIIGENLLPIDFDIASNLQNSKDESHSSIENIPNRQADVILSSSSKETKIKDFGIQTLEVEISRQQTLVAPPIPKKPPRNEINTLNYDSLVKIDGFQPVEQNGSNLLDDSLQIDENSLSLCEAKLVTYPRSSEPSEIEIALPKVKKVNGGAKFKEDISEALNLATSNEVVDKKEYQNDNELTKKESCQKQAEISPNILRITTGSNKAYEGRSPPLAPDQSSHTNIPGMTRKDGSQSRLTTDSYDLHLPPSRESSSSMKCIDKCHSSSITKLAEIDNKNIFVVNAAEDCKNLSSDENGSLSTSPLAPHRKRKSHVMPEIQPLKLQSLPSGPAEIVADGVLKEREPKINDRKAPPRPPVPLNYNVSLARQTTYVHVPEEPFSKPSSTETRDCLKTSQKPPIISKTSRKVSLNPFDSEEEEENEPTSEINTSFNPFDEEEEKTEPVSCMGLAKTSSKKSDKVVSLNPFDSEDEDEEKELGPIVQTTSHTKASLPPTGYNPFDEDEEEEENTEKLSVVPTHRNAQGQRSNTLLHSTYQNRSETSACERKPFKRVPLNPFDEDEDEKSETFIPSRTPVKPVSLNPFDEEDDEEEDTNVETPFLRVSSSPQQQSQPKIFSTFQEEASKSTLSNSERFIKRRNKRQAPLPPGYGSPDGLFSHATLRLPQGHMMYPRAGSSSSLNVMNETSWRHDNTSKIFGSTLSLFSTKRKPPPRPPPPKWK